MTTTINASPTNGLVQTADGSGVLKVQSNGVTTNALAWVKFAGSTASIAASYNVSSVTRNAAGNYSINFSNAMTNANYTPCAMATSLVSGTTCCVTDSTGNDGTISQTTSAFIVSTRGINNLFQADPTAVFVSVFGN